MLFALWCRRYVLDPIVELDGTTAVLHGTPGTAHKSHYAANHRVKLEDGSWQ